MNRKSGFTMIELMIVIVIIGILASMGGSTYIKSMSKGRDARRISDMQEVQKGFETYYAKSADQSYGATCPVMFTDPTIFPSMRAPTEVGNKLYTDFNCNSSSYCYCTGVEIPEKNGNSTNAKCAFFPTGLTTTHYCVQNVQ